MFGALLLFEDEFIHVVSISFTGLILTELIMVALTIRTWHWLMVIAEFISLAIYILSLIILKDIFGKFFFLYFNQPSDKGPSINDVSSEWEGGGSPFKADLLNKLIYNLSQQGEGGGS